LALQDGEKQALQDDDEQDALTNTNNNCFKRRRCVLNWLHKMTAMDFSPHFSSLILLVRMDISFTLRPGISYIHGSDCFQHR